MPIYEYRCDKGHQFEVMQRISDDPVSSCEVCEAPVRKVLSPVAIHFKGSGFYNTDYGTRKRAREMNESKEGKSSSDSSSKDKSSDTTSSSDSKSSESKSESNGSSKSDSSSKKTEAKAA